MNFEAYFIKTKEQNIAFSTAYKILRDLLNITSIEGDKLLTELVKQYGY